MEKSVNHSCLYLGHVWGDWLAHYYSFGLFGEVQNIRYWEGRVCANCKESETKTEVHSEVAQPRDLARLY